MSSRKNILASGLTALLVAVALIATATFTGVPLTNKNLGSSGRGVLSFLVTDPPHIPLGVTGIYMTYSQLALHMPASPQTHKWVVINAQGSINLLNAINVSQTIASARVKSGAYDKLLFNISSSLVTYNGRNYTAFVPANALFIPIVGSITVNGSRASATLINISPTVINIGNSSHPEVIIRYVAYAKPIPSAEVSPKLAQKGFKTDFSRRAWFRQFQANITVNAEVTSVTLTSDSLRITLQNTSNRTVVMKVAVVEPVPAQLTGSLKHRLPPLLPGAAVFIAKETGVLQPITIANPAEANAKVHVKTIFSGAGVILAPGSSTTLTFIGTIPFNFGIPEGAPIHGLIPGNQYIVLVIGEDLVVDTVITAGS